MTTTTNTNTLCRLTLTSDAGVVTDLGRFSDVADEDGVSNLSAFLWDVFGICGWDRRASTYFFGGTYAGHTLRMEWVAPPCSHREQVKAATLALFA